MGNYTGTDNLEVMEEAVNYKKYLCSLVLKYSSLNDRVLDFGAGIGTFSKAISQQGLKISCLEPDKLQANVISEQGFEVYTDLDQINDSSISYVYSLNVLEHIENEIEILCKISRKLTNDGKLFIYVPAFNILFSEMDRKVGHHRRYTRTSLIEVVEKSGFEVVTTYYADSLGFLATLIYKIIGSKDGLVDRDALKLYDRLFFPLSCFLDVLFKRVFGKNVVLYAKKRTHEN